MLIPDSFTSAYDNIIAEWKLIKEEVDGVLGKLVHSVPSASFNSRIKSLESVFVKAQKGEYEHPLIEMDDIFACQIIVPANTHIPLVKKLVYETFVVKEETVRWPIPNIFDYNDKKFILRLKDFPYRQDKSVLNKEFELQVKTFLQSALQQATHDIVYKPKKISYWTERIASQLRAILELADDVLTQLENTAEALHAESQIEENNYRKESKEILRILETYFNENELPADKRRTAFIVEKYLNMAGLEVTKLENILHNLKQANDPIFDFLTLTVTDKLFIILYNTNPTKISGKFQSGKSKTVITTEMEDFFPQLKQLSNSGKVKY